MDDFLTKFQAIPGKRALWLAGRSVPEYPVEDLTVVRAGEPFPGEAGAFEKILWTEPCHFSGNRKSFCAEIAEWLVRAGFLYLQTRIVPATLLRGRKGREVKLAADYLNAFHRFLAPGTADAVSHHVWKSWLESAGLQILSLELNDQLMTLEPHPTHSPRDLIRIKVLLRHAPPLANERLTPHLGNDRIQFHVYQAKMICQLKSYE